MSSPASIHDHPIHPMLIVFPIALWIFSLACDIIYYAGSHSQFWQEAAFYAIAGGIAGALLAAVPGFIDFLSLRDGRVKKIATMHMVLNLIVVAIFIFNLGIRYYGLASGEQFGLILSIFGIGLMSVSGWLGGSLVYVHHVGVTPARETRQERRAA